MDESLRKEADRRFEEALSETGSRDPRVFYRDRLRELRSESPERYEQAVRYYEDVLVPTVASGSVDPLKAWLGYGITLAELTAPGAAVDVDVSGRSGGHDPEGPAERMVLHIPTQKNRRAILVSLPAELSKAQRATFDMLVRGRQKLRD